MDQMPQSINDALKDGSTWKRIISMLVLGFAYGVAETVLIALVVAQVLFRLVSGNTNEPMKAMGKKVADYIYRILMFLTYNSDYRPFPFSAWSDDANSNVIVPPATHGTD